MWQAVVAFGLGFALTATPAVAAPIVQAADTAATPAAMLKAKTDELIAILADRGEYDRYFSAPFKTEIPHEKWAALTAQIRASLGAPLRIETLNPHGAWAADLVVSYERGTANMTLSIDPAPPHVVTGLRITGTSLRDDSYARLETDFRALPGASGFAVTALGDGPPAVVARYNADTPAPLGSAFKLWVLAEAGRQIAAGKRSWRDVVTVGPRSLASGLLHNWPADAPVTLQTLATLMISISDNTATDTLVLIEGRQLDAFVAGAGAPGLAPVLTTRQMFALKSPGNADLAARWTADRSPAARRALIDATAARLTATPIDPALFAGKPVAIDTLEWFASPDQVAGMLDRLRTASDTVRAILAVNSGVDPITRGTFDYLGFKGGSEPGVITLNFLLRRKDGRWLAVAGNWHRSDAGVDVAVFAQLMTRALVLASSAPLR